MKNLNKRLESIESKANKEHSVLSRNWPKYITLEELEDFGMDESLDFCMDFSKNEEIPQVLEMCDPICAKKILSDGKTDSFWDDLINEKPEHPESQFIQIQNPESKEWCLIDREKARVTKSQKEKFKGVPEITI